MCERERNLDGFFRVTIDICERETNLDSILIANEIVDEETRMKKNYYLKLILKRLIFSGIELF